MNKIMKAAFKKAHKELESYMRGKDKEIKSVLSQYVNGQKTLDELPENCDLFLMIGAVYLYLKQNSKL